MTYFHAMITLNQVRCHFATVWIILERMFGNIKKDSKCYLFLTVNNRSTIDMDGNTRHIRSFIRS